MTYIYPEAAEELKLLGDRLKALKCLWARLEEINTAKYSIGSSTCATSPLPGGGSRHEDKIGSLIAKGSEAEDEYIKLKLSCVPALAALDALPDDERRTLDMCFVKREYGWHKRAADIMHLSTQRVYQIKDRALRRYAEIRGFVE